MRLAATFPDTRWTIGSWPRRKYWQRSPARIPAGIARGQRLRLEGEGEAGRSGGGKGDLYVVFDIADDPLYERDGFDLHRRMDVPWPLLVLGGDPIPPSSSGLESLLHPGELLCDRLAADGSCGIYPSRPLICRTHGFLHLSGR